MGTFQPDAQAFINFYTGETAKDQQIDDAVDLLKKKNPTDDVIVVKVKTKPASANTKKDIDILLTTLEMDTWTGDKTRLYLHGHGSSKNQTIGGWNAKEVAGLLKGVDVSRLRILGCRAARAKTGTDNTALDVALENSVNSFAGTLCGLLKNEKMEIHANYYTQAIAEKERRSTKMEDIVKAVDREAGENPLFVKSVVIGTKTHHGAVKNKKLFDALKSSIVIFVWKGGKVERSWKTTGKYK